MQEKESLTDGVGAMLRIDDDREGRKMLDRIEETDAIEPDRAREDGVSMVLILDAVDCIAMLLVLLVGVEVDVPSLESTRTISY